MAAVKWFVGKLTKDVGRYSAGQVVPFKHKGAGAPSDEVYGHLFSTWSGPYKSKQTAWDKARG